MAYQVTLVGPNGKVVFDASPTLSEDGGANYDGYNIIHLPSTMVAYRNSNGRRFGINGQFISRNAAEAKRNIGFLDLLRAWRLPEFGGNGATPPILKLYAYNNKNINGRQVVLDSYSFSFDSATDYIYDVSQPMPIIGAISVQLTEMYSAEQITAKMWKMDMGSQSRGFGGLGGLASGLTGALSSMVTGAIGGAINDAIQSNPIGVGLIGGIAAGLGGGNSIVDGLTSTISSGGTGILNNAIENAIQSNPIGAGLVGGLAAGLGGDGIVSRVGNMIENSIQNEVPGKLAGALAGAVGKTLLGNSKVQELVNHLPGVAKNAFVSGTNVLINQISKSTQSAVTGMVNAPRQPIADNKTPPQGILEL